MPANEHIESFLRRVKRVRYLLDRQLRLSSRNLVTKTDIEAIYELSFLNVFVSFETEIYELLKTNMLMKYAVTGRRRSLLVPDSRSLADRILLGTSRYVQLLPVEQMERTAKVYLKDGIPFTLLSKHHKNALKSGHAIRNHIAHRSSQSYATYKKIILDSTRLPRKSSIPGFYLRSHQTRTVTYFDYHVAEIGACLRHLCDNT